MTTSALAPIKAAGMAQTVPTFEEGLRMAFQKAVASAAVTAGLAGGMTAAAYAAQRQHAKHLEQRKLEGFEKMLSKNPGLAATDNQEQVVELYDSLHGIAPTVAEHPHLAGSLIRSAINYGDEGGFTPDVASNLIKMEAAHSQNPAQQVRMSPMARLAIAGTLPKL